MEIWTVTQVMQGDTTPWTKSYRNERAAVDAVSDDYGNYCDEIGTEDREEPTRDTNCVPGGFCLVYSDIECEYHVRRTELED